MSSSTHTHPAAAIGATPGIHGAASDTNQNHSGVAPAPATPLAPANTSLQGGAPGALALVVPSPLTGRGQGEGCPVQGDGARPEGLSAADLRKHFAFIEAALDRDRREAIAFIIDIAARTAPADQDTFITGLCQLSKQSSSLNSWLLGAQLAIRLGQPIKPS